CRRHYIHWWRYDDPKIPGVDVPEPLPGRCDCGAVAEWKGMCKPHAQRVYYETNRDYLTEYRREYQKANPEVWAAREGRRPKLAGEGLDALDKALAVDYRRAIVDDACGYCGGPSKHTDHVFPIAKGGRDVWYNLMRACESCNLVKGPRCGTWFRLRTGFWQTPN